MSDVPLNETCACGDVCWHKLVTEQTVWCRRCGALRLIVEPRWRIPLDRAGELAHTVPEEEPTRPGTPDAMKR